MATSFFEIPEATYETLTPLQKFVFDDLLSNIKQVSARPDGFTLVINAMFASFGEDLTQRLRAFLVGTHGINPRDLNALCAGIEGKVVQVEIPPIKPLDQ